MTKISTFFSRSRELILVDAQVIGRSGRTTGVRLAVDTGSAATTLTPERCQENRVQPEGWIQGRNGHHGDRRGVRVLAACCAARRARNREAELRRNGVS